MNKRRSIGMLVLLAAMLPALACGDPTMPFPDDQDSEDEGNKNPDREGGQAFLLRLVSDPVVV